MGQSQSSESESNGQSKLMKLLHANRSFCCILTSIKRFSFRLPFHCISDFPLASWPTPLEFLFTLVSDIASRTFCNFRICINNSCQSPSFNFSLLVFRLARVITTGGEFTILQVSASPLSVQEIANLKL